MGSSSELEYQILLSRDLDYVNNKDFETIANNIIEVKRMLSALLKKLKANSQ